MEGSDVYANITCLVYSYNGTGWFNFFSHIFMLTLGLLELIIMLCD